MLLESNLSSMMLTLKSDILNKTKVLYQTRMDWTVINSIFCAEISEKHLTVSGHNASNMNESLKLLCHKCF